MYRNKLWNGLYASRGKRLGDAHHSVTGHLFYSSQLMIALTTIKARGHKNEVNGWGNIGTLSNRKEVCGLLYVLD